MLKIKFAYALQLCLSGIILTFISLPLFADSQVANKNLVLLSVQEKLANLEKTIGGKIGISALDTTNNRLIQYRAYERFPMLSTFKIFGVAEILKQSMNDNQVLTQKIKYGKADLVPWSPITVHHLKDGMTVSALCAAAISYSDNTAANLITKKLGGPQALNAFAREIGDSTFNLNNIIGNLNSDPNNMCDTSSPAAMQDSLQKLAFSHILDLAQREQLLTWMKKTTTGKKRIRAGVPKGWLVADKTGTGDYGVTNDIGIIWPPQSAPIIVAIFFVKNKKDAVRRHDAIMKATRILLDEFAKTNQSIKLEN